MTDILARWNRLPVAEAENEILPCCGSRAWARGLANRRPIADEASLLAASDETWRALGESDWLEAFRSHPRIGETRAEHYVGHRCVGERSADERSSAWSAQEQSGVAGGAQGLTRETPNEADAVKIALVAANREYEKRFGRIFIVCATGKSAAEMLALLRRRMQNSAAAELLEAAEQQRQITQIRLRKWLTA
jgi:2-oxo-4-hydroxy-4-carboxy-5-ureidoimidazoline decarboxylase